ncbi:MAG: ComEC/Rec2 family competence protein [Bacteroidota bacterium]
MKHSPMLLWSFCFASGILLKETQLFSLLLVALAALCLAIGMQHRWSRVIGMASVVCCGLSLGNLWQALPETPAQSPDLEWINCHSVRLLGFAEKGLKTGTKGQKGTIRMTSWYDGQAWHPISGKSIVYLPKNHQVMNPGPYDSLFVQGALRNIWTMHTGYQTYLQEQDIHHSLFADTLIQGRSQSSLMAMSWEIQQSGKRLITRQIRDIELAGMAQAMILGDKQNLPQKVRESFRRTGLSHILALSGMHVAIVCLILTFLLKPFERGRSGLILSRMFMLLILGGYVLTCGSGPSLVRAGLMLAGFVLIRLCRLRCQLFNLLGLAAFLQLLFDPGLIYAIGFQLSYAAVFAMLWLLPLLDRWLGEQIRMIRWIYGVLGATLVASLGTLPFVMYHFGEFPTWFLLSNLLMSVLIFPTIFLCVMVIVFAWLPIVSDWLGTLAAYCLDSMAGLAELLSELPYSLTSTNHTEGLPIIVAQLMTTAVLFYLPRGLKKLNHVKQNVKKVPLRINGIEAN